MILMFNIVINFDSIASYDIVVKDIAKQQQKGWGQLNKTYMSALCTQVRDVYETVMRMLHYFVLCGWKKIYLY